MEFKQFDGPSRVLVSLGKTLIRGRLQAIGPPGFPPRVPSCSAINTSHRCTYTTTRERLGGHTPGDFKQ